jgi:hypothetical protein
VSSAPNPQQLTEETYMEERITKATIGQRYFSACIPGNEKIRFIVGPACEKNRGVWHCITHDETFHNQFQKDSHIDNRNPGKHCLVWICYDHGPEVP